MAMTVAAGSLHKPFDLTLRQVLPLAVMRVGQATSANCSLYRVGEKQLERRLESG
jgi:hypothetical protein